MSTLRGPAQLAGLQGALCVPTYNLTNGVVDRPWAFWDRGFKSHIHHNKLFQTFPIHVDLEKCSPRYTQEMKRLGY